MTDYIPQAAESTNKLMSSLLIMYSVCTVFRINQTVLEKAVGSGSVYSRSFTLCSVSYYQFNRNAVVLLLLFRPFTPAIY